MKRKLLYLFILGQSAVYAQDFEEINTTIKNYYYASSDIADYDNDGDLDILLSGAMDLNGNELPETTDCTLYQNTNNTYTAVQNFPVYARHMGDVKFIDIDNDGDKDILIGGTNYETTTKPKIDIYKNNNGKFEHSQNIDSETYAQMDITDENHDGNLDFINFATNKSTKVFLSKNQQFQPFKIDIDFTQNGNVRFRDIDNDGVVEILLSGKTQGENPVLQVLKKTKNKYIVVQELSGISDGTIELADFNADGLLDIVASGLDKDLNAKIKVYFNTGNITFKEVLNQDGVEISSGGKNIAVGDINNDGYSDFVIAGDIDLEPVLKTFLYNPETANFDFTVLNGILPLGGNSNIQLFDYNNNNTLDMLLSGFATINEKYISVTKLFENKTIINNKKPSPPTELKETKIGNKITFSWNGASDDKTPEKALRYILRVGSQPGAKDIAQYDVSSKNWVLDIPALPTHVYWSVQSIDASNTKSVEATEKQVGTLAIAQHELVKNIELYPNPTTDLVNIQTVIEIKSILIYDLTGQLIKTQKTAPIHLSDAAAGIYYAHIEFENGQKSIQKIIKR